MVNVKILMMILMFCGASGFSFSQEAKGPSDFLSADFHQKRRELLRKRMPSNSVAVFFSSPVKKMSNDVDYLYHPDRDFYYLTGYREPDAVLLVFKAPQKTESGEKYTELIFVRPHSPYSEAWEGPRLGVDGTVEKLKIQKVLSNRDFKDYNLDFDQFDRIYFYDFAPFERYTFFNVFLSDLISDFKKKIGFGPEKMNGDPSKNNLDRINLKDFMIDLRGIKTKEELQLLKKAVEISCVGQVEVMKAMKPGMSEREVQGIHEFVSHKYGAEAQGYPSIVGSGKNSCILHYFDNHKPEIGSEDLVLMDVGAQYRGYSADVTRTIPSDGTFSPEQKAIYELVLKAQEAAIKQCVAGESWKKPQATAEQIIGQGLVALGIIDHPDKAGRYAPHGISHHIGLDVHDRGRTGLFESGMVITVEPGIYIPEGADCDEKWWNIGVRIEDCIVIKNFGKPEVLSSMAPKTVAEIEEMMKQSSVFDQFVLPDLDK